MTVLSRRPFLRWLVPAAAALVLATAGSIAGVLSANAGSPLAERSAAQLLVDVQKARLDGLSGTIVQTANLGLPSLPGIAGSGSSEMSSLVAGSHTLRLWYAGPDHVRLALQGTLGESDLVRNGTSLWMWSSQDKSATHRSVPLSTPDTPGSLAGTSPMTPQQAADQALKAISSSTVVTTDGTARVARRPAYELVLQPKDPGSLVGSVHIAVDSQTRVPTRVQVYAKGQSKPSFEVGFDKFYPTTPDASTFSFNPPPGTKVTQSGGQSGTQSGTRSGSHGSSSDGSLTRPGAGAASGQQPKVVGSGWTSVLVAKVPTGSAGATGSAGSLTRVLKELRMVSGTWGKGHLLQGTLFSALLTDDGRLVVGAVGPDALYTALAG